MDSRDDLLGRGVGLGTGLSQYYRLFDFGGRATRTELISFWLLALVLAIAVGVTATFLGSSSRAVGILLPLSCLILFSPWPALLVRRVHDQGSSGAWAAVCVTGIVLISVFGSHTPMSDRGSLEVLLGTVLSFMHFILSLAPGTYGPNKFGPDPRLDETEGFVVPG